MNRYKRVITFAIIFTFIIFLTVNSEIVFSASTSGELNIQNLINGNKDNLSDQNVKKDGGVELEGVIGDWDLNDGISGKLNYLNDSEVTGITPKGGQYFTIAATVPLNMEFGVYRNSGNPTMGYFYSPNYKIINHGSKALNVKVGFEKGIGSDPEKTLFIEKPTRYNGKIEIDLNLSYIQKGNLEEKVDLTEDLSSKDKRKKVGVLAPNEEAVVTFKSDNWEPLSWEPNVRDSVTCSGKLILELSY